MDLDWILDWNGISWTAIWSLINNGNQILCVRIYGESAKGVEMAVEHKVMFSDIFIYIYAKVMYYAYIDYRDIQ